MSQQVYVDPSVQIRPGMPIVGWNQKKQETVKTTAVVSIVSTGREQVVRTEAGGEFTIVRR